MLRNPSDMGFYAVVGAGAFVYLFLNRDVPVEGSDLLMPAVALPSILGALVVFGAFIGPANSLANEREDGTLLRLKSVPHGMTGYVTGQALFQSLGAVPALAVLLVPSLIVFDGIMHRGAMGWLTLLWAVVLGMLAVMPLGMIMGALVSSPRRVQGVALPIMALTAVSGIFIPLEDLPPVVEDSAQVFPVYWVALAMRSALLPESAAALEIGESWRTLETIGVLGTWAAAGLIIAPIVLRRMARRESGSAVESRRHEAQQRI
jgi:ABC-2 type transport system permease protein